MAERQPKEVDYHHGGSQKITKVKTCGERLALNMSHPDRQFLLEYTGRLLADFVIVQTLTSWLHRLRHAMRW